MASTIAIYTGNGTQTDFTVPFDYLAKKFVRVLIGTRQLTGGDYGDTSKDYYFLDKTTVRLKTPPAVGDVVTVRRYTSATDRVVSFKDASILKATDLDTSSVQTIHIAEEGRDVINDALIVDREGNWDAKGKRIVNVGKPIDDNDAMTYGIYKEDALGALQSKLDAEKARDRAIEAETNSKKSEENAKLSEINAKASAGTAVSASKHADAVMVENQAILNEAREIHVSIMDAESTANESALVATQKADAAKKSEINAKISEENAKKSELNAKASEDAVTNIGSTIVPIAPEIKIVADNITHVVTDSQHIDKINIVGTDLTGSLSDTVFEDYGDLGDTGGSLPTITGGNIKIVADNIEVIRTVAGLAPEFETVVNSVGTVTQLTIRAEKASTDAQGSATEAGRQVNLAKAEVTKATEQANLATQKANEADADATSASASATQADSHAKNASASAGTATAQATLATQQATAAKTSADNAALSKDAAKTSETNAKASEVEAKKQADLAKEYAGQASVGQVNSDWAETSPESKAFIKNKPIIGALASKDALSYNDLTDKPSLDGFASKNELQTGLAGKANTKHSHSISEVTDLQEAINNKLDVAIFNGMVDYGDLSNP